MSPHRLGLLPGALLLASAAAPAQQIFIVDWDGEPGSVTLQEALATAVHGDRIFIRPGPATGSFSYGGGVTDQGISIIGQGRPRLSSLRVIGLPAGRRFVLRGVELTTDSPFFTEALRLQDNAGAVVIEDVEAFEGPYTLSTFTLDTQVLVDDCASVSFARSTLQGGPAIDVRRSTVAVTSCELTGHPWQMHRPYAAAYALEATDAKLVITDTRVTGGAGSPPARPETATSAPAARLVDTDAVFTGRGTSVLAAGPAPPSVAVPAVEISGGSLLETGVSLLPQGGAPALSGATTRVSGQVPALTGNPPVLGMPLQVSVETEPGSTAAFFFGAPGVATPVAVSPHASWWLAPAPLGLSFPVAVGIQGRAWFQARLPNVTALAGRPLALQAIAGGPSQPLSLSNPLFDVLRYP